MCNKYTDGRDVQNVTAVRMKVARSIETSVLHDVTFRKTNVSVHCIIQYITKCFGLSGQTTWNNSFFPTQIGMYLPAISSENSTKPFSKMFGYSNIRR